MKFEVGDRVKCKKLNGVVITVYYHRVMVNFGINYGVILVKKMDVEKIK